MHDHPQALDVPDASLLVVAHYTGKTLLVVRPDAADHRQRVTMRSDDPLGR